MKRPMLWCLVTSLLWVPMSAAQVRGKQPGSAAVTDIRKVDFLNSTYPSSLCSQEYGRLGIGKVVRVRNGEFKAKSSYFAVAGDRIIYADVTGDGREDAVVPVDCGAIGANFSRSEVYVYTVQNGRATLLAEISDKVLERDYRHAYPDAETYWGMDENGLKVKDGHLEFVVLTDGSHASPQYLVTLDYRWRGAALALMGKPQRKSAAAP